MQECCPIWDVETDFLQWILNAPDSVDRMTPFFFSCNWWLCRTSVAYIVAQRKFDEENSIRLSTDFKDLITANKPFDVSDCYKMEFEFFSLLILHQHQQQQRKYTFKSSDIWFRQTITNTNGFSALAIDWWSTVRIGMHRTLTCAMNANSQNWSIVSR